MGWSEERNNDFNNIEKQLIISQLCLAQYNGNKKTNITTDTCNSGLGIALSQKQHNTYLKHRFRQLIPKRGRNKFSRRIGIIGGGLGFGTVRILSTRETSTIVFRPPNLGAIFKEKQDKQTV